ncbi:unnamed protein product [Spirodela intermedia]|uniref:Uncharacterized protein n=1 Tax=Spirodela intermedia TaxID=51605 RepID=A0A7I8IBF9_SPIIN|nr:unnamed protein product [Spirodela intermedia]CAA6655086.1 unnamed protein product [Spirodela intermedia]
MEQPLLSSRMIFLHTRLPLGRRGEMAVLPVRWEDGLGAPPAGVRGGHQRRGDQVSAVVLRVILPPFHSRRPGQLAAPVGSRPRPILDEVEARHLLIDHVGHHWCWGDCNVYVGTLETFIEEREAMREIEPYQGGKFDGRDRGPELGIWELDLRAEFPLLYVPQKETKIKIPHSEVVEKCSGCEGRGQVACGTCNKSQEPGSYKRNQMFQCLPCYGRGLIAHKDGSDTLCTNCSGKGSIPCATCGSRGLIECQTCQGRGSLLARTIALVRWRTLSTRKVSAASGAASVPEEVFHRAQGVQLCNTQAHQCSPAYFPDSYSLNKFSSEVVAGRCPVPPAARIICERHVVSVIPVTRVTMAHRRQAFSFYVVGLSREVFVRDYPSRFCWGLCCCLEWLKM